MLAVDDSAVMRGILQSVFRKYAEEQLPGQVPMELCGAAHDGMDGLAAVTRLRPDVVILDLEMPRMNGLDVLERLRFDEPGLPVILCSSYTEHGARATLDALALGASDYVMKPSEQHSPQSAMQLLSQELLPKIVSLASGDAPSAGPIRRAVRTPAARSAEAGKPSRRRVEIVVIGVSTGGPAALGKLLPGLAASFPVPVLIVQHMPKLFTLALAERLDHLCALRVREAYDGASIAPGAIWMAPGDAHMEVGHAGTGDSGLLNAPYGSAGPGLPAFVRLHQQRPLNHCRPSVDYLFSSAARMYGAGTLALIMTGMGSDGLSGARCVHQAGGTVLTQDEATSAVWGMPGRVVREGLAHAIIPLHALAEELTARVHSGRSTSSSGPAPVTPERRSLAWDADVEGIHGLL